MNLRRLVKRSVALTCLYYLVDDRLARRRLARGRLATRSGTRHATLSLDDSLDYIDRVYEDYLAYGGVERLSDRVAQADAPAESFFRSSGLHFDCIVSRAVLEHHPQHSPHRTNDA